MYTFNGISIRPIVESDLYRLWELVYKEDQPEWKRWDAPYYEHQSMDYDTFVTKGRKWIEQDDFWAIQVKDKVCGTVSYYWEHEPSKWLEMGIALYEPGNWGKGLGTTALKLWMDHLFTVLPLVRVGFTTWSGNERMMAVGEKLGMQVEARIRKVRLYNGHYYDSIRMGILREEWEALNQSIALN